MNGFDYKQVYYDVVLALGDFVDDFDVDGIVCELRDLYNNGIDIENDVDWFDVIEKHDISVKE